MASSYEQLVKALRVRSRNLCPGDICDICEEIHFLCSDKVMHDAADAIEELQAMLTEADKKQAYQHDYVCELVAKNEELKAEAKQSEPKQGEWINSKERMRPDMCSVCGCVYEADRFMDKIAWNYCPNCGAKMEVQDDKA